MPHKRTNLMGMLKGQRGLMALLAIGAALLLLAVAVPQTWATPDQDRLRKSTTKVYPDKPPIQCYRACDEPIYVYGSGFVTGTDFISYTGTATLYLTSNVEWISGTTSVDPPNPVDLIVFNAVSVTIVEGSFDMVLIWDPPPDLEAGGYDLFVDVNGNQILDNGDGINNIRPNTNPDFSWDGAGLCVDPCKDVGGFTLERRQHWLVPIAAVVVAIVVGGAATGLAWTRRRG